MLVGTTVSGNGLSALLTLAVIEREEPRPIFCDKKKRRRLRAWLPRGRGRWFLDTAVLPPHVFCKSQYLSTQPRKHIISYQGHIISCILFLCTAVQSLFCYFALLYRIIYHMIYHIIRRDIIFRTCFDLPKYPHKLGLEKCWDGFLKPKKCRFCSVLSMPFCSHKKWS